MPAIQAFVDRNNSQHRGEVRRTVGVKRVECYWLMPSLSNEVIWWLLLGVLVGWILFWIVDLVFRRDGDKATEREKAKIKTLDKQLGDQKQELTRLRTDLDKQKGDNRNLTKLSEELRDSVSDRDQKIANLENALDASREQLAAAQAPIKEANRQASSKLIQGLSGAAAAGAAGIAMAKTDQEPTPAHDVLPADEADLAARTSNGPADVVDIDAGRPDTDASDRGTGSLAARIGAGSDDDLGPPDNNEAKKRPGLLDRLKDSLAGRRPEDLD